ncbi:hypothetical protein PC121_g17040 [Phytophthora cactorum]|nr:hypothetical protein PC121_g17040 [Phytophthora cactorum]
MNMLHTQLLQLKPDDIIVEPSVTPLLAGRYRTKRRRQTLHTHKQFDDWVTVSGVQKRRQRSCKVCALLRGDRNKSYHTTFFCEDCSHGEAKCFLYPKARREYNGKRVVLRRPGKVGRRKKTRRELLQDGGAADDEEDD